jgi:hypothetical protein
MAVPTTTSPATSGGRIKRSFYQTVGGVALSVLVAVNAESVGVGKAGKYGGIVGGSIFAVALLQNLAERFGWVNTK